MTSADKVKEPSISSGSLLEKTMQHKMQHGFLEKLITMRFAACFAIGSNPVTSIFLWVIKNPRKYRKPQMYQGFVA